MQYNFILIGSLSCKKLCILDTKFSKDMEYIIIQLHYYIPLLKLTVLLYKFVVNSVSLGNKNFALI